MFVATFFVLIDNLLILQKKCCDNVSVFKYQSNPVSKLHF